MIFIDINDWEFSARTEQGTVLYNARAGASTAQGPLVFGDAANQCSRTHPQRFNNKYLYTLAAEPIAGDLKPAKNHADLIYHHLLQLQLPADKPITFCVGGHLTLTHLGLLLGIAKEAKLDVKGFLDSALAHSLSTPFTENYHVLDLELHRLVVSHVSITNNERTAGNTTTYDGMGAAAIIEGWMNVIADEFVQKTRFDPLHTGACEQQLLDQINGWMGEQKLKDQHISLSYADANRDIDVAASLLSDKLQQRLTGCDFESISRLLLSPRAARMRGLKDALAKRIAQVMVADEASLPNNYHTLTQSLSDQGVRRIITAKTDLEVAPATTKQKATHLLLHNQAHPLSAQRFAKHLDPQHSKTRSTDIAVNGVIAPGETVYVGDRVLLQELTYTAITVL